MNPGVPLQVNVTGRRWVDFKDLSQVSYFIEVDVIRVKYRQSHALSLSSFLSLSLSLFSRTQVGDITLHVHYMFRVEIVPLSF